MCDCPDLFTEHWVKARKEHRCCECPGVIPKGKMYLTSSGLWDGEFFRFKTCLGCAVNREMYSKAATAALGYAVCCEDLPPFGGLRDYIVEHFRFG